MTLDAIITRRFKIVLENLYMPSGVDGSNQVASRHIVICVSGFLSEKGEMNSQWKYLTDECRKKSMPLYTVRWEAKTQKELESIAIEQAKTNLAPVLSNTKKLSDLFTA